MRLGALLELQLREKTGPVFPSILLSNALEVGARIHKGVGRGLNRASGRDVAFQYSREVEPVAIAVTVMSRLG